MDLLAKEHHVITRPTVAKKRRKRWIDLAPNALARLDEFKARGGHMEGAIVPLSASTLRRKRRRNALAAGLTEWPQQRARHTYCSCRLRQHGDINKLVLQAGHESAATMWDHYYQAVTTEAATDGRTTPDHRVCRITDKRKLAMKFHLSPTEEYSDNHWESETGIWTIDIWNGKNAPHEGWPATLKSCRWVIELCYDGQRYNDPRWGNDRCCSFGLVGFFSLEQTMEAFMLLEKVLSVIPETVDPAKINGLFNAVSADRYIRRDEEVWLPVLIALADLVEILQSIT